MTTYQDLPAPDENAVQRSKMLCAAIQQKIQQHKGKIPFSLFMELSLYHPELGYYQAQNFTLGRHGDFTTAPEISPLFAKCFARQYVQICQSQQLNTVLELGAGTGRFALDFLLALEVDHALPERYFIYEISTSLQQAQRALFAAERPDLLSRLEWIDALPAAFSGVVIANEVLDAIPFDCFEVVDGHGRARMVTTENDRFIWSTTTDSELAADEEVEKLIKEYALADGYQSEIHLPAMNLVRELCESLTKGVILLADYGYGQREYYHPQRNQGSLSCFYQHRLLHDPFLYPGLQDITAHVDFTRVIETAAGSGTALLGFTTQSAFLLANDLLAFAQAEEDHGSEADAFKLHQAIKVLTMPMEMGDRVKIMALGKHVDISLRGFTSLDRRRDL
jgi:SAM-dependent MidA family methyltransferase